MKERVREDPMRQLQEAMIRIAENQAQFYERQPVQPVLVQRTIVDVNTTLYKNFKARDPPMFTGTKGEEDAENWMTRIKQIFDIMEMAEDDRLKLAIFLLVEEAQYWWKSTERVLTTGPDVRISWRSFEEAFNEKYFLYLIRVST